MSKEEELGRRLCEYLGVDISYENDLIILKHPDRIRPDDKLTYDSWSAILFGTATQYGLCDLHKWRVYYDFNGIHESLKKSFEFSLLDELELKLSVRGVLR